MTLDFFSADNFFQKPAQNVSENRDARKNYKPNEKDRDAFKVSNQNETRVRNTQQSSGQDTSTSEKRDFYQILQNVRSGSATPQEIANLSVPVTTALETPQDASIFSTDETALPELLNAIEPGAGIKLNPESTKVENVDTVANIAALNAEIQAIIADQITRQKDLNSTGQTQITTTPEQATQDLESLFTLLTSVIEDESGENPEAQNAFVAILQDLKGASTLDPTIEVAEGEEPNITLSNLTPAELAELQKIIQQYVSDELEKRDQNVLDALASQAASVIQQTPKQESDAARVNLPPVQKADASIKPEQQNQPLQTQPSTDSRYDARYDSRYETPAHQQAQTNTGAQQTSAGFKGVLESAQSSNITLPSQSGLTPDAQLTAGERFLQANALTNNNAFNAENFTVSTSTTSQTLIAPLQNSLASSVTQSASATQAHPATQLVSATIQKAVKAGEETNIKLRLDPPDLGRVEVKMSIDKDNATRIVLTADKPETYMMLKQDAEILERAMAEAGLDTNGELSFELASENDGRGKDNESKMGGNTTASDNDADEILETTMDWQVDPETGRMRYNALV